MTQEPSSDALRVEVPFDRKETSAANWEAMNRGPLLKRPIIFLPAAVVLGLGISWLAKLVPTLLQSRGMLGSLLVLLVSLGGAVYVIKMQAPLREQLKRRERQPDVYTLDDGGLEISGADDLTLMSWPSMTRVHETDRFFLFVAGPEVQYLPKRALSRGQEDLVRALVLRHGPAARKALPGPGGGAS